MPTGDGGGVLSTELGMGERARGTQIFCFHFLARRTIVANIAVEIAILVTWKRRGGGARGKTSGGRPPTASSTDG
jgi:hypothetical protein